MIEPRRDAYGPEADRSNLADYLELLALQGRRLRRAELEDYLSDTDWVVRSRELFHQGNTSADPVPTEDDEEGPAPSQSELSAADIFAFVDQRADALGDLYPFEIQNSSVIRRPEESPHRAYLLLLSITAAHHYAVTTPMSPERVFEQLVADVMASRGLLTVDTGSLGRERGDFRDLVRRVAEGVELTSAPEATSSRTHANEEGVDTVSHLSWGDLRAGHWVYLGQATCARSNEWQRKMKEPDPRQWGPLLACLVEPLAYLAVPHHVEDEHITHLSGSTGRLVLDRLRLARHLREITADQAAVLTAVAEEPIFSPTD